MNFIVVCPFGKILDTNMLKLFELQRNTCMSTQWDQCTRPVCWHSNLLPCVCLCCSLERKFDKFFSHISFKIHHVLQIKFCIFTNAHSFSSSYVYLSCFVWGVNCLFQVLISISSGPWPIRSKAVHHLCINVCAFCGKFVTGNRTRSFKLGSMLLGVVRKTPVTTPSSNELRVSMSKTRKSQWLLRFSFLQRCFLTILHVLPMSFCRSSLVSAPLTVRSQWPSKAPTWE